MLRKAIHIILSVVFLATTVGYTVTKHFCRSTLAGVSLNAAVPGACCNTNSCCHSESTFYQVDDDYSVPSNVEANQVPSTDVFFSSIFLIQGYKPFNPDFATFLVAGSPPPLKTQTILSLLQTYQL